MKRPFSVTKRGSEEMNTCPLRSSNCECNGKGRCFGIVICAVQLWVISGNEQACAKNTTDIKQSSVKRSERSVDSSVEDSSVEKSTYMRIHTRCRARGTFYIINLDLRLQKPYIRVTYACCIYDFTCRL